MFELEKAVLQWRERQERETSLAPCELDELEDHLRARFDLELELDAALASATAFAIARRELGEAATLSKEFAKAGKARWRRWLLTGWAMFAGSFFLPDGAVARYEMLWRMLQDWSAVDLAQTLIPELAMILTLPALLGPHPFPGRWVRWFLTGFGLLSVGAGLMGSVVLVWHGALPLVWAQLIGFWARSLSFVCAAAALWLRDRERAGTRAQEATA